MTPANGDVPTEYIIDTYRASIALRYDKCVSWVVVGFRCIASGHMTILQVHTVLVHLNISFVSF